MMTETVNQIIDWYETHELRQFSPVALKERQRIWKLFRAQAGHLLVDQCRVAELHVFLAAQKGVKSNWTRRRIKATINRPFNVACDAGLIARNPFKGLKIPKGKDGRDWTEAEYLSILRASRPYFRRLVIFIRFSGARPGEGRMGSWNNVSEIYAKPVIAGVSKNFWNASVLLHPEPTNDCHVFTAPLDARISAVIGCVRETQMTSVFINGIGNQLHCHNPLVGWQGNNGIARR